MSNWEKNIRKVVPYVPGASVSDVTFANLVNSNSRTSFSVIGSPPGVVEITKSHCDIVPLNTSTAVSLDNTYHAPVAAKSKISINTGVIIIMVLLLLKIFLILLIITVCSLFLFRIPVNIYINNTFNNTNKNW